MISDVRQSFTVSTLPWLDGGSLYRCDLNTRKVEKFSGARYCGSPVFVFHRGPILTLQLIGVLRTYGAGFDILYCTRADIVGGDGKITVRYPCFPHSTFCLTDRGQN
jgi:hypothetical protein